MTRRQLLEGADSEELSTWMAYDRLYGLPDPNVAAAQLQAAIFAAQGAKRRLTVFDFLPDAYRPQTPRQSPAVAREMFRKLTAGIPRVERH